MLTVSTDPLTPKLIRRIKDDVGNCWRDVGEELGLEEGQLQNIDNECNEMREKARKVLTIWTRKEGKEATVGRLASALNTIGHKWIADKLPGM